MGATEQLYRGWIGAVEGYVGVMYSTEGLIHIYIYIYMSGIADGPSIHMGIVAKEMETTT